MSFPHTESVGSERTRSRNTRYDVTREQFESMVARIIEYVHAGDAFQVVPSQRFSAPAPVETAIAGLEGPLSRYLLELEPERAEGRSWYGGPGAAELVEWRPVLDRAGVRASPDRVTAV